jgi:hypothetical protein
MVVVGRSISILALIVAGCSRSSPPAADPEARAIGSTPAPPLREGCAVPDPVLLEASAPRVGSELSGPARIVARWTLAPPGGAPFVAWATCRGEGDGKICGLSIAALAKPSAIMAHAPVGWGDVSLEVAAAPSAYVLHGSDGGGAFSRTIRAHPSGAIGIGPRTDE